MRLAGLLTLGLSFEGPRFLMPRKAISEPLDYIPGVQGVAYEPFLNGTLRSEEQIRQDLQLIADLKSPVLRIYGLEGVLSMIPSICEEKGLLFYAAARLNNDVGDQEQLDALIEVARAGYATALGFIAGTNTVTNGTMSVGDLVSAVRYIKDEISDLWPNGTAPVTTAEDWRVWRDNPVLSAECYDRIVNIDPYNDGIGIDDATGYFLDNMMLITSQNGRPVMTHTGWPSIGPDNGNAVASLENQETYLRYVVGVLGTRRYFVPAFDHSGVANPDTQGIFYADRREKEFTEAITPGGHPDTKNSESSGNNGGGCFIGTLR